MDKAKPFDIPKREVWEAFKKVKANQGAAGVDGQTVADFEADLSNNLYLGKLLSSPGSAGRHTKGRQQNGNTAAGDTDGRRQNRPGSRQAVSGACFGADLPQGLLRIPTRPVGDRCRSDGSSAMLAI